MNDDERAELRLRDVREAERQQAQNKEMNELLRVAAAAAIRDRDQRLMLRGGEGRPAWSRELFEIRWRRALRMGGLPDDASAADVAEHFEALDGTRTYHVDALRRLRKRYLRGELKSALSDQESP